MSKLLNNKYALAGLVLAACAFIYLRAVQPAMDYFYPERSEPDPKALAEFFQGHELTDGTYPESSQQGLQFVSKKLNLTNIDVLGLRWNETLDRDPFSHSRLALASTPVLDVIPARLLGVADSRLPRVSAIVYAPELKFAVIEGEILKEGDQYKNYVLKRIENDHISVVQLPQQQWHRLSVTE